MKKISLKFVRNTLAATLIPLFIIILLDWYKFSLISNAFPLGSYITSFFVDVVPPLLVVMVVTIIIYTKPIDDTYKELKKGECNSKLKEKGIKRIVNMPKFILILNSIMFLIGFIGDKIIRQVSGNLTGTELVAYFFFTQASAAIYSYIQISLNSIILKDIREEFRIKTVTRKEMSLKLKSFLIVVFSILFITSYSITSIISFYRNETIHINTMEESLNLGKDKSFALKSYNSIVNPKGEDIVFKVTTTSARERAEGYVRFLIVSFFSLFTVCFVANYFYSKELLNQLKLQKRTIDGILGGKKHINERLNIISNDEVGLLGERINSLLDKFKDILDHVSDSSQVITGSASDLNHNINNATSFADQMSSVSKQITDDSDNQLKAVAKTKDELLNIDSIIEKINSDIAEQTSFIEETSCSMEEMSSSIEAVTRSTSEAKLLSDNLTVVAKDGGEKVNEYLSAIKEIEETSIKVKSITEFLTSIASKTNLLAMNAAIEAAHAKEAGKGFAIVADEVRKLAELSAKSSKNIQAHIGEMINKVTRGVILSQEASKAFNLINRTVQDNSRVMSEISSAMDEQSVGTKEILNSIHIAVKSAESVKQMAIELRSKSGTISTSIKALEAQSTHISSATREQEKASSENIKLFENIQRISDNNEDVAKNLRVFIEEFQYT